MLLTAICVVIAPQYLSNGSLLTTNCLEPNLWMGCAYFAILAVNWHNPRYWLWFGVVAGIGLQEKYSIAVFGLGMVIGLLLTEQRRVFLNKWIWLGGAAAFLIFLPNILWNIHYHWPFVQLMHAIRAEGRDVVLGPIAFFFQQTLLLDPITAPIWLAGLFGLLFSKQLRPYRMLGWCYVVCLCRLRRAARQELLPRADLSHAAGRRRHRDSIRTGSTVNPVPRACNGSSLRSRFILLASGAHLVPITVPVLSPERFIAYTKTLPFKLPVTEHSHARAPLPQWYSDQFGWKEIADETEVAWNRIPAAKRADCGIFAQDYGQAGAIDFFGRKQGLPGAMSGDRTYWLWGPRGYSGNCMIVLDDRQDVLERYWQECRTGRHLSAKQIRPRTADSRFHLQGQAIRFLDERLAASQALAVIKKQYIELLVVLRGARLA